jgi:transmembrane sensor
LDQDQNHAEMTAATAAAFAARVHDPDATEEDWLALERWLAESSTNLRAYDAAERLWLELDQARPELAASLVAEPDNKVIPLARVRFRRFRWMLPAAAAAAAALAAVAIGPMFTRPSETLYRTAAGEVRTVALEDGSVIRLNGGSSVTVRIGRRERRVEMNMAEASFDVAKDPKRPFVVDAGEVDVRVVGTEFNVARNPGRTTVTVRRGIVEVRPQSGGAPARLTAGSSLVRTAGASKVFKVDPDAAFLWQEGRLVYDAAPLTQVATDLSRRFATPVEVRGAARSLTFTGVLVVDDEQAVLRRLADFLPIKVERTQKVTILEGR